MTRIGIMAAIVVGVLIWSKFGPKYFSEEDLIKQDRAWREGHNGWGSCIAYRNMRGKIYRIECVLPEEGTNANKNWKRGIKINRDHSWLIPNPQNDEECLNSHYSWDEPACILVPRDLTT